MKKPRWSTMAMTAIAVVMASAILARAGTVTTIASTIPGKGDVNPYAVFRVPTSVGHLTAGNILVSNFNNSSNLQGTGTTIVEVSPTGAVSLFAAINPKSLPGACPGGVGLTTALVVLRSGWLIVGSLPTSDGTAATAKAGCLLVLNSEGHVVETLSNQSINRPRDMTVLDRTGAMGGTAVLFVTNVLNGTVAAGGDVRHHGTVLRIELGVAPGVNPRVQSQAIIASGFCERTDPAALVIGPTGLTLSEDAKTLYVADSLNNRIAAIGNPLTRTTSAQTGTTVSSGGSLNDPLGMTLGPEGNILTVNGNNGFLVETTPAGAQIAAVLLDNTGDPPGNGTLFGLIDVPGMGVVSVDDGSNTLNLYH
jgi:SMP-30/Gluconolactonase/LRE-like region